MDGAPIPRDPAGGVPSPCTGDCELDARAQTCRGCLRTMDEIVGWPAFTDAQKRAVLLQLQERRTPFLETMP